VAASPRVDRRTFLELAAASSLVAVTAGAAAGCQGGTGAAPGEVDAATTGTVAAGLAFAPLRAATVPYEIEPAVRFQPLPRS